MTSFPFLGLSELVSDRLSNMACPLLPLEEEVSGGLAVVSCSISALWVRMLSNERASIIPGLVKSSVSMRCDMIGLSAGLGSRRLRHQSASDSPSSLIMGERTLWL
jgi:hypothetical protein